MLNKQRVKTIFGIGMMTIVTAISAVSSSTASFAQPANNANGSANVLKVSPVRSDMQVEAGSSKTLKMTVTNLTNSSITVRPIENDFIAGDERGTPALILDADKYAPTHSLKRFMKPIADVTIPAAQGKTVEVVIAVPKGTQAGGYFGAIRFAPTSPNGGGQVNLSASAASLILLTVPGNIVEKLALTDFSIQQDGKNASYFQSANDIQATVRFENKGGAQLGPFGKVSVKEGDKIIYDTDFNNKNPRDMVLPDSARRWDIPLKKLGSFGHYTVLATFTYGKTNQTIEVSKSFWIIPSTVIVAAVVGVIAVIALIVGIWFFLRSYKRRILRHHGHSRGGLHHR